MISTLLKEQEKAFDEKFYEDFGKYWSKESAHCEQQYLTPDTRGIIKDFIKSFLRSSQQDLIKAVIAKIKGMTIMVDKNTPAMEDNNSYVGGFNSALALISTSLKEAISANK